MRKVAHLKVVVVVKVVWGIFNNINGLYLQDNTLLVIYKSQCYSMYSGRGTFIQNRFSEQQWLRDIGKKAWKVTLKWVLSIQAHDPYLNMIKIV